MEYLHKLSTKEEYIQKVLRTSDIKAPSCVFIEDENEVVYDTPKLPLSSEEIKLKTPLTFNILTDGTLKWKHSNYSSKTIKYSKNGGDWIEITSSADGIEISVQTGDVLQFKGNNSTYGSHSTINAHFEGTAKFNASGNIMSLLNEREDLYCKLKTFGLYAPSAIFAGLFSSSKIVSAKNLLLPAETLESYCYAYMFHGCSELIETPILPATTLASYCYKNMFSSCNKLTTAPELPATTLTNYCYTYMFASCSALTTVPELPAKQVPSYSYSYMFQYCSNLVNAPTMNGVNLEDHACDNMFSYCRKLKNVGNITINSVKSYSCCAMFSTCDMLTTTPNLPATTLFNYCYTSMFFNCVALTTSPVLPATTLTQGCYSLMFKGCSSLNYITCLATDMSATSCTNEWVGKTSYTAGANGYSNYTGQVGVASTGTFVKANGVTWSSGSSGVPSTWTQQVYQE